jgi:hypothetical protein
VDGPLFVTLVKYGGEALFGIVPRKVKVRPAGRREGGKEGETEGGTGEGS